jgi:hypothetical protein
MAVSEILEMADISYTTFNKMRKYAPNQFPKRSNKSENIISASFVPKPGKGYFFKVSRWLFALLDQDTNTASKTGVAW